MRLGHRFRPWSRRADQSTPVPTKSRPVATLEPRWSRVYTRRSRLRCRRLPEPHQGSSANARLDDLACVQRRNSPVHACQYRLLAIPRPRDHACMPMRTSECLADGRREPSLSRAVHLCAGQRDHPVLAASVRAATGARRRPGPSRRVLLDRRNCESYGLCPSRRANSFVAGHCRGTPALPVGDCFQVVHEE